MAFTGFDANEVNRSVGDIIQAYNNLYNALYNDMQNIFVNKLCEAWYAKAAVDFIGTVKEADDSLLKDIDQIFESVANAMNSAAKAWAQQTGDEGTYTARTLTLNSGRINTSNAKENNDGKRGVEPEIANEAKGNLSKIKTYTDQALTSARNAVNECGFLGGDQANALQNALEQIKNNVNKALEEMASALEQAVSTTLQNYEALSSNVSGKFSGK